MRAMIASAALALSVSAALADPVGVYDVSGLDGSGGVTYTGTVRVDRTGDTYAVYWKIGPDEFAGTGIGARLLADGIEVGSGSTADRGLSIGYVSKDNFGIAMYFEQPDGTWRGVWTYGGGRNVAVEVWERR